MHDILRLPKTQLVLDLNTKLTVDNFAGGGGASTGIEIALGRHVDHSINHDRLALGMHWINHPQGDHHIEDVFDINPAAICQGRPVGLAHFSPDCRHFSKAKGGKPLDRRIRGLALIMLRWAQYGAEVMTMENVEEIITWGPLKKMRKGRRWGWFPDPEHKGRTWMAFLSCLSTGIEANHPDLPEILDALGGSVTAEECVRGFGYQYHAQVIRACDHGAPTIRKRLFAIFRCDGKPIIWPEPTHFDPRVANGRRPWRTIAECVDWNLPCPSIFLAGAEARQAKCKRPLAQATLSRIAKGIDRHVLRAAKPFLVNVTHQGGDRVEPLDEPARTVTGAHRGEKALVFPSLIEHANSTTARTFSATAPLRTQCAAVKGGHFALIAASVVTNTSGHAGGAADAPASTIATGGHHALLAATLIQTGYGEREGQGPRVLDLHRPQAGAHRGYPRRGGRAGSQR